MSERCSIHDFADLDPRCILDADHPGECKPAATMGDEARGMCHGCLKPIPDPLPALLRRADEALKLASRFLHADEADVGNAISALIDLAAILKEMGPR
jgi:hypothetical protein